MPITIDVAKTELWNEKSQEFIVVPESHIVMEHSLISISKWESKWLKPWINRDDGNRSAEEWLSYLECMTITPNVDQIVYKCFSGDNIKKVISYIECPMTATVFSTNGSNKKNKFNQKRIVTSEEIYYEMIKYGIPFSCEKWPLNRLLTLIRICNIKESNGNGSSKMSQKEIMRQNSELNALRRASSRSRG